MLGHNHTIPVSPRLTDVVLHIEINLYALTQSEGHQVINLQCMLLVGSGA